MSRVVLKISGEALKDKESNVCNASLQKIHMIVKMLKNDNHKVSIVIGGGNFFRGRNHLEMDEIDRDTIGMLGTVMNALYIKDYLIKNNINSIVTTPFSFPNLITEYSKEEINNHYNNGDVIVFGGGIGKSGFSTDSGTILAAETLNADLIIKITNVDGVYDSDPNVNKNAKKYDKVSYDEAIDKKLKIMDEYAFLKCRDLKIKIIVMNFSKYEKILEAINNGNIGTIVG